MKRAVVLALCLGCAPAPSAGPKPPPVSGDGGSGAPATGGSGGTPAPDSAASSDASAPDASTSASDAMMATDRPPGGASAGCGHDNPGGTFMIAAGASQTPYRVVLPTPYDPNRPYPVVLYLHGRGNNIEGQANLTNDVAMAGLGIVVYPKSFGASGWETPGRDHPAENLALLRALIQHLGEQYCVDGKRIVLSGFSSGCWFASRMACSMKAELAAVVAAGCSLDPMGRCPDAKPMTYIIGRGDPEFGRAPAAAEFYRTRNRCQMSRQPAATAPCEAYDGCAPGMPTNYCVHPGGHMWPAFASKAVVELLDHL
jgi:polyhydroxybutyrate depolymerase